MCKGYAVRNPMKPFASRVFSTREEALSWIKAFNATGVQINFLIEEV